MAAPSPRAGPVSATSHFTGAPSPRFAAANRSLGVAATDFAASANALNASIGSPKMSALSISPSQRRRRLTSVVPSLTVTIASRNDNCSRIAQLVVAVAQLKDVEYIEGTKLGVNDITDPVAAVAHLAMRLPAATPATIEESLPWLQHANNPAVKHTELLTAANKQLLNSTYLIAPVLTAADLALYVTIHSSILGLSVSERSQYVQLVRWFNHIQSHPHIRESNLLSFVFQLAPPSSIYTNTIAATAAAAKLSKATTAAVVDKPAAVDKLLAAQPAAKAAAVTAAAPAPAADAVAAAKPAKAAKPVAAAAAAAVVVGCPAVYRADIRVARICTVAAHPTEAKLLVFTVDVNEAGVLRQVVGGVAEYYNTTAAQQQLIGQHVLCFCNLKASEVKGVNSEGRFLVATTAADAAAVNKELITVDAATVATGTAVTFAGVDKPADAQLASKNMSELIKYFTTDADRVVQWKGIELKVKATGADNSINVLSATIANGTVA